MAQPHHHTPALSAILGATQSGGDRLGGVAAQRARVRYTIDPAPSIISLLEDRVLHRDWRDRPVLQAHSAYARDVSGTMAPAEAAHDDTHSMHCCLHALSSTQMLPSFADPASAASGYCARHVHTSVNNRVRCAVHTVAFVPDKPRVVTGSAAGQFTAWNASTFNFDVVVQAHLRSIRSMRWSHDGEWMLSGDEGGVVKYWQSNMRPQEEFIAHPDAAVRAISFSPSDRKFATCSDDKTVRYVAQPPQHNEEMHKSVCSFLCVHVRPR